MQHSQATQVAISLLWLPQANCCSRMCAACAYIKLGQLQVQATLLGGAQVLAQDLPEKVPVLFPGRHILLCQLQEGLCPP